MWECCRSNDYFIFRLLRFEVVNGSEVYAHVCIIVLDNDKVKWRLVRGSMTLVWAGVRKVGDWNDEYWRSSRWLVFAWERILGISFASC